MLLADEKGRRTGGLRKEIRNVLVWPIIPSTAEARPWGSGNPCDSGFFALFAENQDHALSGSESAWIRKH